jgi:hypothetical protein
MFVNHCLSIYVFWLPLWYLQTGLNLAMFHCNACSKSWEWTVMHLYLRCINIFSFCHLSIEFVLFRRFGIFCFPFYLLKRYYFLWYLLFVLLSIWFLVFQCSGLRFLSSFNMLSYCQFVFKLTLIIVQLLCYHMRYKIFTCSDGIMRVLISINTFEISTI